MLLVPTPSQAEGPFYPEQSQQHKSNHLYLAETSNHPDRSIIIKGRVQTTQGMSISHAVVVIWQADHHGRYNHPKDHMHPYPIDHNFQYTGQYTTNASGHYNFLTIKPGAYNDSGDWRTPHIHFKVYLSPQNCVLTTQMYFTGEPLNDNDHHLNQLSVDQRPHLLAKERHTATHRDYVFNLTIDTSA